MISLAKLMFEYSSMSGVVSLSQQLLELCDGVVILHNYVNRAALLIRCGADVNYSDSRGCSPLIYACHRRKEALADLLIDAGADINATSTVDNYTPLSLSIGWNLSIAERLVRLGANVNVTGTFGSPLSLACNNNDSSLVQLLFDAGATIHNHRDYFGCTMLHYAAENLELRVIKRMIESGAEIDAVNDSGETPLMCAVRNNDLSVALYLIETGADIHLRNCDEESVVHSAVHSGHVLLDVITTMHQHGADIDASNKFGNTPLIVACSDEKNAAYVNLFLSLGANVNKLNKRGFVPMDYVIQNRACKCALLLLDVRCIMTNERTINFTWAFGFFPTEP